MTEAIYLDIDGTLRNEQTGIPKSAVWALRQCSLRKIKIIICTGRNPITIQDDVLSLPLNGIISGGGCYIEYDGKILWKKYFPMQMIERVIRFISGENLSLVLETEQAVYMDCGAAKFYREDIGRKISGFNQRQKELFFIQNKITYQDNMRLFYKEKSFAHKICIIGNRTGISKVKELLKDEAEIIQEKYWNSQWYLELLPKGCDKGSAVRRLNRSLGIPKKNTICFGDSENDITMMEESGIAVAVGNCNPIIQTYASSISESVMEDGIYKELIRRNIIKPYVRRNSKYENTVVARRGCISNLSEKLL